jgi:mRNA degradation ribonuclease J1/J2
MVTRQIKREMRELGIESNIIKEIESKFVILDHHHISQKADEDVPDRHKINGETVDIYWEHLEGERLNQFERYPVVKIGDFTVRVGPMPHSDPGFMYEILTPAGSHLHTGDFKMDPTIQLYQPSFKTWLKQCEASTASIDSTGATRDENERTPWESEIEDNTVKLFRDNPDNRFIISIIGSNAARFTTLVSAMGKAEKKYLIADGTALENLYDDLNAVYDFKKWAKEKHNVTIVKRQSIEAKRILDEESKSNYALCVTGTQLEATSSLNRALANWLPDGRYEIGENDIIVPLQGPIPVGDNMQRRQAAQYFAEMFHGCKFILPEAVEKESDLCLSGSGHASPMDIKELYSYLKNLKTVFPVHGGPAQLSAGAKIAEREGYEAVIADNFDNFSITKKGHVQKLKTETAEMVGVKSHLPDEYSFWLRRHFSTTVAPIPMNDNSPTGMVLEQFEKGLSSNLNLPPRSLLKETARFHISRTFNMSAQGGFLAGRYRFGIEKLDTPIWDAKAIGVVSAFDTETTGTDERFDFIDQFSMTSYDLNRKRINQIELKQAIPGYAIPNPEALLVTVTEPGQKDDRELHPVLFADQIIESLNKSKIKAKEIARDRLPQMFKDNPSARAKMLFIAHNFPFDDRQLKALFKDTLSSSVRPHATDGVIGIDTLHIARAIHAIYPDKFKVRKYDDSDYLNFTLQALCEENNVSYDLSKAHNSALYDSERAIKLFWKMHDAAPEIVEQMIFNADSSKGHLLNDMVGYDTGVNGPHPVFSYLSKRRDRTDLRMGCFVGTIDGGSKAVIANLSQNPQDVLSLSPAEIANRLADRYDDSLEVIDLRQNPMVFPAKYFYEKNTSKKFPREMFDRRARIVKEYLNFREADLGMTNIHERLSKAWDDKKKEILFKYAIVDKREPNLNATSMQIYRDAENYKQSMRNDKPHGSKKSFNPPAQNTIKAIKSYRQALVTYLASDTSSKRQIAALNKLYKAVVDDNKPTEGQKFLVANLHYDIAPHIIEPELRQSVESQRAFHAKHSLDRAVHVMNKLETDQNHYDKIIGRSLKKRKIFQLLKSLIVDLKKVKPYDANAAKSAITPWRLSA